MSVILKLNFIIMKGTLGIYSALYKLIFDSREFNFLIVD